MEARRSAGFGNGQTDEVRNAMYTTESTSPSTFNDSWSCLVCTLINNKDAFECEVCGSFKKNDSSLMPSKTSLDSKEVTPQSVVPDPEVKHPTSSNSTKQTMPQPSLTPSSFRSVDTVGLSAPGLRRLGKERREIQNKKIEGVQLLEDLGTIWLMEIEGAKNTLYENERFTISFKFGYRYPFDAPEVIFTKTPPVHPHVYSNGHICLSILYDGWTPVLGVSSVCLSLISMLSSCNKKEKPIDDMLYCRKTDSSCSPKLTNWFFHDDKV
ncbi:ubiquitin-conjugating enzyme subfamily protein [Cardiosporidium cionae]|uniref:Ubiquitin-conjugating enzyme subfamily protein n=1 Tax=Cardiosporidium cionae TaxID=476202 RepID=A0ABQ7JGL5_9APIC|nr:ubiquitin-conjugating enzyme subfamily protein [Cardiosporidium cionae]|eukprot:KAF8823099.1 ubiquitin-conjugating enzyme subfamily protein [Cardiosporidium cionae]